MRQRFNNQPRPRQPSGGGKTKPGKPKTGTRVGKKKIKIMQTTEVEMLSNQEIADLLIILLDEIKERNFENVQHFLDTFKK